MKFLLDHDVPDEVAQVLKHLGHEATLVREALSARAEDPEVFGHAQSQGRSEPLETPTFRKSQFQQAKTFPR